MRAEKRLRAPDGGLESLSVKEDSEKDKRFLKKESSSTFICNSTNQFTGL